ncbi:Ribosomal RNA large subunit methyltransferase H [Madurella fahalii]|uniref:Ribosomal RNA large subunit methyltransferase H n=1 Tax=Madurella fahalii TaxID=1157608 RepID=A0ABQ0GLH2_9PEZI
MERHITNLAPFLPREPIPLGLQSRRVTRHGFLSNRWGVRKPASASRPSASKQTYPKVLRGWSGLPLARKRRSAETVVDSTAALEPQSKPDDNYGDLRDELHSLWNSVRRLADKMDELPDRVAVSLDQSLERQVNSRVAECSHMEKIHELEKARLKLEHRIQVDDLIKDIAANMERLQQLERELETANTQVQFAAGGGGEFTKARGKKDAQATPISEYTILKNQEKAIKTAFKTLRTSILDFSMSFAVQLGPLPDAPRKWNRFCSTNIWNRASTRQRSCRIMAKIFQLLFRRILRPGLRAFGLQAFLRSEEHHEISGPETRLRALEKELEIHNVNDMTLSSWIAATIDVAAPLIDLERLVEGVTNEIAEALSPVIRFAFTRNSNMVKNEISAICQKAVRLKLAMRGTPGGYKIEVPSRDTKTWGEPGCDDETQVLNSGMWLQVIEHEINPATANDADGSKRASGDIACIPFGALTKLGEREDGTTSKVILEKGWVVSMGVVGERKQKAESSPVLLDEQPAKHVDTNREISPANLARIKALVDAE